MRKNNARLYMPTRIAIRLMLLIFVRSSELRTTPWSEINLDTGEWIIPWQRMKMGKRAKNSASTDHQVCLPLQGLELLRELKTCTGTRQWAAEPVNLDVKVGAHRPLYWVPAEQSRPLDQ